ncbi:hypothetical protein MRX96_022621 [Rhipicephalus microplus]
MIEDAKKTTNRLQRKISRLNKSLQTLQSQHDTVRERLQAFESNKEIACFVSVLRAADEGHKTAVIKNQVSNFASKKPAYTESILRECVFWKACSNKGYEYVRTRGLFKLPRRATLQKYIGHSTVVTSLITERLGAEFQALQVEQEIFCSLIIDEMAIQQKVMYDRQLDKVFGLVDMGPEQQSCATPEVPKRLLCFVLRGLSTAYVITVGYFFTRCLRSEQLRSMTMTVIKAVEDVGFRVTRIVTDNHQSNVALFKSLSEDGMLAHVVPHPLRQEVPGLAQRPIPTIDAAENGAERPIPTSETEQDEDVRSSVSETTAVATGLRADLGSRIMARVQELENDLSKFCADPSNRITVTCRNYILGRVFELARLCSDLRTDADAERAVVSSLQGQLVEARRETATMQRLRDRRSEMS